MSADDKAGLHQQQVAVTFGPPSTPTMTLSDGTRRFKTYGKHRSQVAVSRRDWWSTVNETAAGSGASTSTAEQDSQEGYGRDGTSPSHRAAKKASTAIALDEVDDSDYAPAVKKRVHRIPQNTRSRMTDTDDSDSYEDCKTTNSTQTQWPTASGSVCISTPDTLPDAALNLIVNTPEQQPGRTISLSSNSSEDDKIKPARRKPSRATKAAPIRKKRTIIEDTPPVSPERPSSGIKHVQDVQAYHRSDEPSLAAAAKPPSARTSPIKTIHPSKTSILSRKDSNHLHAASSAGSSPQKKQASLASISLALTTKSSAAAKENVDPFIKSSQPRSNALLPVNTVRTPSKGSSHRPSVLQPSEALRHSRPLASSRYPRSSSSYSSMSLPSPRGHHSQSAVTWRRPLAPIIPVITNTESRSEPMRVNRGPSSREKISTSSSATRKTLESASSASIKSAVSAIRTQGSKNIHVVVEVPLGLPRSRSPAPIMKEPRRRQVSAQSTCSSSSSMSASTSGNQYSPLARQNCAKQSIAQPTTPTHIEVPVLMDKVGTEGHTVLQLDSLDSQSNSPSAPLPTHQEIPPELVSLLEHCDGLTPSSPAEVLDFTSFVSTPTPLLSAPSEQVNSVQWRKLGEATFSEVFILSEGFPSPDLMQTGSTVVKVIPLHMSPEQAAQEEKVEEAFAKAEEKSEEAFTTSIEDLAREIRIFRALSKQGELARTGWPTFKGAYLAKGAYPERLLSEWDAFKESNPKRAENPRPDTFASYQMYALICMNHAGTDLESVKLKTWSEAATILWQVASALSKAEAMLKFEHRDLHWGNILVQRSASEVAEDPSELETPETDLPDYLALSGRTVSATIIDFTLSRATVPASTHSPVAGEVEVLAGGFDDAWMFTGEGDYQYECYRIMKRLVRDKWDIYCPATNLVWLHYLVKKLLQDKGLKKPVQRMATRSAVIKAKLPGTPLRSRTRRGQSASKQPSKPSSPSDISFERAAYETLLAAEAILSRAVTSALQNLPKSTSLVQMMSDIHLGALPIQCRNDSDDLACAGDFLMWWRKL